MKRTDESGNTLELLRDLPTEVSIDQVAQLVIAFPLAATTASWLAHLKIHLNSILMTTAGSIIIGGSIYLMSADAPSNQVRTAVDPAPSITVESILAPAIPEEPAVVLGLPAPSAKNAVEAQPTPLVDAERVVPPTEPTPEPGPTDEALIAIIPIAPLEPLDAVVLRTNGSGKTFDLRGFTAVAVHGYLDVVVEQGDFSVTATGEDEELERLVLTVQNGTLVVDLGRSSSYKSACYNKEGVKVMVHMPQLDRVQVLGSGAVHAGTFTKGGDLVLDLQGSGDIHIRRFDELASVNVVLGGSGDIIIDELRVKGLTKVELAGSGDVYIAGSTAMIELNLMGSGDLDMSELEAGTGKVQVVGSGDAYVNCIGALDRLVLGSGDIHLTRNAGGSGPRGVGAQSY